VLSLYELVSNSARYALRASLSAFQPGLAQADMLTKAPDRARAELLKSRLAMPGVLTRSENHG
jgi:hypothetical protein